MKILESHKNEINQRNNLLIYFSIPYEISGIEEEGDVKLQEITVEKSLENMNSKFLTSYYLDSLALAADLKISELKYKPDVSWFANGGMNAVYLPSLNRLGFSTGITFSMVLSDGKTARN